MKNNLRNPIYTLLLASGILFTAGACSRSETETKTTTETTTTTTDGDAAYSNYRTYVEEAERDTNYTYASDRDWNKEIADRETAYNERLAAVESNAAGYDDARKAELEELKTRYNTNWQTRRETYSSYGRANTMRPELLSIEENANDLSALTAANIRAAYENFVSVVERNKKNYTNADWQIVEQSWNDLDDRKNAIQTELSAKDKYEIGKAKSKYIAMKSASKTGNTAEKVGSDVKGAAQSGAETTEDAAQTAGEKTESTAKKAANKTENAAKKVGSETKELYKKGEDKVDGTDDRK